MSADGWDTTELGKQGGETFSADYDPARGVVRLSGNGLEEQEFPVDADRWQEQAARELATRGYGARWNQWEEGPDGTRVMSTARTRFPDSEPATQARDDDDSWESGAARYSAAAGYEPPQYGRVRVYPQYTFPVYQSGVGGIGLDQEITVTDWRKQGRDWAEAEARRQVTEALGEPSDDATGGPWWMGRPVKDAFRWQPLKGTPRTALPNDGLPEPEPWQPWRADETGTAAETGTGTEPGGPRIPVPDGERINPRDDPAGWAAAQTDGKLVDMASRRGLLPRVKEAIAEEQQQRAGESRVGPDGQPMTAQQYDQLVDAAAAAGTPYVLRGQDVQPGDRVLDTSNGELGTVAEADDRGVRVRYDRELTPGQPGSAGVHVLASALPGGTLQRVPRDATYASLEDRRPPAEQAARYAQRQAHYEQEHGPGKRGKKGWTAHRRGCRVCTDMDAGGDGTGRRLQVLAPAAAPAAAAPAGAPGQDYPVRFTFAGDEATEVRHWRWEAALDAVQDQIGGWVIPDDGTGVLDVDAFIASIGGYVNGLGGVLGGLAEELGGGQTPIAPIVGEALADFAAALQVMSGEAAQVHEQWRNNDDNAHDLRRAEGEIPNASLFNVTV